MVSGLSGTIRKGQKLMTLADILVGWRMRQTCSRPTTYAAEIIIQDNG